MKTCFKCKVPKPLSEFYAHPRMADGKLNKCKECACLDVVRNRARKLQYYQAYDRVRSELPHRKALGSLGTFRRNHPEKAKAHTIVNRAVSCGKLLKKSCEVCGNPKTEAHHHDYTRPLEVRWLCAKHHHAAHRKYDYSKF